MAARWAVLALCSLVGASACRDRLAVDHLQGLRVNLTFKREGTSMRFQPHTVSVSDATRIVALARLIRDAELCEAHKSSSSGYLTFQYSDGRSAEVTLVSTRDEHRVHLRFADSFMCVRRDAFAKALADVGLASEMLPR